MIVVTLCKLSVTRSTSGTNMNSCCWTVYRQHIPTNPEILCRIRFLRRWTHQNVSSSFSVFVCGFEAERFGSGALGEACPILVRENIRSGLFETESYLVLP
jgi:hypothetical protein